MHSNASTARCHCGASATPRNAVLTPAVAMVVRAGDGEPSSTATTSRLVASAVVATRVTCAPVTVAVRPRTPAVRPELIVVASDHVTPLNVHFWMPPPEPGARSSATYRVLLPRNTYPYGLAPEVGIPDSDVA